MERKKKSNKKFTQEYVENFFKEQGCELQDVYINNRTKLKYICNCGNSATVRFEHFKKGVRCKDCGYKKNSKRFSLTFQQIKDRFLAAGREVLQDYYNQGEPILNRCHCGNITKTSIKNINYISGCLKCAILKGENHPMWTGKYTEVERINSRKYPEYTKWKHEVHKRDNYMCVICNSSHKVHAHHIENYSENKEKQLSVENGITLCPECHVDFHNKYGYRNNNKLQLEEYIKERLK